MGRTEIAQLAQIVTKSAESGDSTATLIIEEAAREAALMVKAVYEKLFGGYKEDIPVVLVGSLANSKGLVE